MEYLIGLGVLGLGYQLQTNKDTKLKKNFIGDVPKNQIPSVQNTYTSKRAYNIFQEEQNKANILLEKSKYPQDTNVVTPGPPFPIMYNKVDYTQSTLPVEFNSYAKYDDIIIDNNNIDKDQERNFNRIQNNKSLPDSGGFQGISLTGNPIDPNKFTHNNQVPFFGGNVRQNLDEFSTRGIFENFTGTQDNYQKKQEQSLLFEPQKNMSNVYGTGSLDGFMIDRYYVSNIRSNETPIEKVYVGPGLNQGYTNEPSGGFQQPDAQDYSMPKTTDEIRVKTNPKVSYYGRIVSGSKIAKPGKIGTVYKNKPDTFYVQEPDRYLTTTGAVIAPEQRPCIVTKYTNRKTTELKTRTGSAAPIHGTVAQVRSKYKISNKVTYREDGPRNADATGAWGIIKNMLGFNENTPNDYGKQSIRIRDNKRVLNNENDKGNNVMNFKSSIEKGLARNNQKLKNTKKINIVKNNRINGNYQGIKKSKIYDPNDVPKSTIKETNIHNNHSGMMSTSMPSKGIAYDPNDLARTTIKETNIHNDYSSNIQNINRGNVVYDPNDVTRTTIKETNIHNNHSGMLSSAMQNKGIAYDPNDLARTTIKETNIHNEYNSNIQNMNRGNVVYDPNDLARTTIKETNIHNNHSGNIGKNAPSRGVVYDPNNVPKTTTKETTIKNNRKANIQNSKNGNYIKNKDKAKTTMKQTTMASNVMGIASQMRGDGHLVKGMQVPDTIREHSSVQYMGDAQGREMGAYDVTDVTAMNTNRQFTSDIEYFGGVGNDGVNTAPMSYEDVYNMEMKAIRSLTDNGYTPNPGGVNEILDSNQINMTTTRIGDIQNKYLNERGVSTDKIYNSIPQINVTNLSQNKEIVPNEPLADRINPDLLSAFRENPYTQQLTSWA
jgi:hypothetical protein